MKMTPIIFFGITIFFLTASPVFADSSVTVTNNVNSGTDTSSGQNCHTVIHSVVNGKEQDYESSDCGDVQVHTTNDSTTVQTNAISSTVTPAPTHSSMHHSIVKISPILTFSPMPTIDQQKIKNTIEKTKQQVEQQAKKMKEQEQNFLAKMQAFFRNLFHF